MGMWKPVGQKPARLPWVPPGGGRLQERLTIEQNPALVMCPHHFASKLCALETVQIFWTPQHQGCLSLFLSAYARSLSKFLKTPTLRLSCLLTATDRSPLCKKKTQLDNLNLQMFCLSIWPMIILNYILCYFLRPFLNLPYLSENLLMSFLILEPARSRLEAAQSRLPSSDCPACEPPNFQQGVQHEDPDLRFVTSTTGGACVKIFSTLAKFLQILGRILF